MESDYIFYEYLGYDYKNELIKPWFEKNNPQKGDYMIIVNPQGSLISPVEYLLAKIEDPAYGKQKRVVLDKSAMWGGNVFYRTGTNCDAPCGKSRMIPPVTPLIQMLLKRENGRVNFPRDDLEELYHLVVEH